MLARAEFTVRPRLPIWQQIGDIDTGYPASGVDSRWVLLQGDEFVMRPRIKEPHKYAGEIKGYWSASPYAANATNAWNVNFNNGNDNVNNKSNSNNVRLVRGGEWIESLTQEAQR